MDWLQSYWGAVVALLIAFGGGPIAIAAYLQPQIKELPQLRDRVARWLVMPSLAEGYRRWLGGELDRFDRWMRGYLSWTAFAWCLAIAFAYPAFLLLLTYGLGGPGTVGETVFFPSFDDWPQPALGFGLMIVMMVLGGMLAFNERIDERVKGRIQRRLERRGVEDAARRADRRYRLVGAITAASLWLAAVFLATGEISAVAGAVAFAGAVAGAAAAAVAGVILYSTGVNELSLAFLLFFVLLPVANAFLDYLSWAVSRWLGRDLHDLMSGNERTLGRYLRLLFGRLTMPAAFGVHVAADLVAAAGFLLLLAGLLPFLVQLFNAGVVWFGEPAPLELRGYLDAARANPWPDGAWALSMLLTTLIPTLLHAVVALMTLFMWLIQPTDWRKAIVEGLQAEPVHGYAVFKATWLAILTPIVAGVVVVLVGYALVEAVDRVGRPVAGILHDAALCGIDLADGLARALGLLSAAPG